VRRDGCRPARQVAEVRRLAAARRGTATASPAPVPAAPKSRSPWIGVYRPNRGPLASAESRRSGSRWLGTRSHRRRWPWRLTTSTPTGRPASSHEPFRLPNLGLLVGRLGIRACPPRRLFDLVPRPAGFARSLAGCPGNEDRTSAPPAVPADTPAPGPAGASRTPPRWSRPHPAQRHAHHRTYVHFIATR
jgi:hypothetical protein